MTGKDLLSQVARLADMPLAAPPMSDDESDCDSGSSSDGSEYNIHGARAPSAGALASRSSRSPSTGPSASFRKSSIAAAAHRSAAAAAARESPSTSVPTATSGPPAGLLLRKGSVNVSAAALRSCQTQRRKASVAPSKPKPRPAVGRRFSVEVGSFKSASAAQQQRQPTHQGGRKSSWLPQRSSSGVTGGGARRSSQSSISRHGVEQSAKPPATETSSPSAQTSSQISPKSAKKLQTDEQYFAKPRRRYTALPVAQQRKDLMGLLKEYYNPADAATHSVEDNEVRIVVASFKNWYKRLRSERLNEKDFFERAEAEGILTHRPEKRRMACGEHEFPAADGRAVAFGVTIEATSPKHLRSIPSDASESVGS